MAGDCVSLIGDFFDCLYCHGIIFPLFMSSSLESSLCKSLTNALRKLIYRKITVEYLNRVCRVVTFLNIQNWCVVVDCQGIILHTAEIWFEITHQVFPSQSHPRRHHVHPRRRHRQYPLFSWRKSIYRRVPRELRGALCCTL